LESKTMAKILSKIIKKSCKNTLNTDPTEHIQPYDSVIQVPIFTSVRTYVLQQNQIVQKQLILIWLPLFLLQKEMCNGMGSFLFLQLLAV
jgi:hypothetical protein